MTDFAEENPLQTKIAHLIVLMAVNALAGAAAAGWSAGVARVNITPREYIWMGGYAKRDRPARGKLTDLWTKAVFLDDGQGNRAVLLTADLVGINRTIALRVRRKISRQLKLPLAGVAINVSHTHSGPVVDTVLTPQHRLTDQQRGAIQRYANRLARKLIRVAVEAARNCAPCQLHWGTGHCGFAVNRRENQESEVPSLIKQNRLEGPVDHSVPVLRVSNAAGQTLALIFGYACHATVTGEYEWSADYPGFAQMAIEQAHPGVVALFWAGCGADQNPLPRRDVKYLKIYGDQLAAAVQRVVDGPMQRIRGPLSTGYQEVALAFGEGPSEREIRETLNHRDPKYVNWAHLLLQRIASPKPLPTHYPYPVQVWRLGNGPTMVLLGGEVVVDYALRLKSLLGDNTWVAGYSNDVMNYIPSRRVFLEGGYEGLTGMYSYGKHAPWTADVEQTIVAAVEQLDGQAEPRQDPMLRRLPAASRQGISEAVITADQPLVHTALLLPLRQDGQVVAPDDAREQTRFLVQQLAQVLQRSGSSLEQLIKLNIYAASPELVPRVERQLVAQLADIVHPAATLVAGDLPDPEVVVALDAVAAAAGAEAGRGSILTHPDVYCEPGHSHAAILPAGEKIFLSGWIHRGQDNLRTAVDETLAFQVRLLESLGGEQQGVTQIRAFVDTHSQYEVVLQGVRHLFRNRPAVPPVVCAPWGREGPPEIEVIAAGRPGSADADQPRVAYFNVPDRPASPVFSRAARVNSPELIYLSGITPATGGEAEAQIREVFAALQSTLRRAGSDLRHMVKATYWLADRDATSALGKVRRQLYDPQRPPAASAFFAQSVGREGRAANVDMIAVPRDEN